MLSATVMPVWCFFSNNNAFGERHHDEQVITVGVWASDESSPGEIRGIYQLKSVDDHNISTSTRKGGGVCKPAEKVPLFRWQRLNKGLHDRLQGGCFCPCESVILSKIVIIVRDACALCHAYHQSLPEGSEICQESVPV